MSSATLRKRLSIMRSRLYLYPEPEPLSRTWLFWLALGLVTAAVAVFCGYFITYLLARHDAFLTNAEDMGIMDQVIWNTAHGHILRETVCNSLHDTNCGGFNGLFRFAIHFEPILFPISLLYWLWSTPKLLLILQTVVVGIGAYPAFWLARLRLRNELAAVAIAVLYLFYPAQQQAIVYDFHAVTFTASLLLFTLYFMYTRRTAWLFVFAILAMACKEEIPLVIMMFGLWSMLFQRRWKSGAVLAGMGILWFVVATVVIMPHFSPTGHALLESHYANKGIGATLLDIVKHPGNALKQYVLESQHRAYLRILLAPAAFLPLFAPWVLVLALPSLAIILLSSDPQYYTGLFHYNAEIVPVLIFATIEALVLILWIVQWLIRCVQNSRFMVTRSHNGNSSIARVGEKFPLRLVNWGLLAVLLCFVLFKAVQADYFFFGNLPFSQNFRWPAISQHELLAQRFVDMVPAGASVSAQTKLVPHLSQREHIFMFPYQDQTANYVLLDTTGDIYPYSNTVDYIREAKSVLLSGNYGVVAADSGFILLKKGLPAPGLSPYSAVKPGSGVDMADALPNLPASFCNDSSVVSQTIPNPLQVTFTGKGGGSMDLVGYNVVTPTAVLSKATGYTHVATYWRVNKPITTPLQILLLVNGNDGHEYFASSDFPTLLWCQTNTWQPGTVIEVNSRVFDLQGSSVPNGLAHMSIALLPLTQSSSTIMDVQARLPLHVVNAPSAVIPTKITNALQIAQLQLGP